MRSKDVVSVDARTAHSRVSVEQAGRSMASVCVGGGQHDPLPLPSCYSTCCMLAVAAHGLRPHIHLYHPRTAGPGCKHTPPASIGTFWAYGLCASLYMCMVDCPCCRQVWRSLICSDLSASARWIPDWSHGWHQNTSYRSHETIWEPCCYSSEGLCRLCMTALLISVL